MKKWSLVIAALCALAVVAIPRIVRYRRADLESLSLTPEVRRNLSGSFVSLPDGTLHYELTGPPAGPVVVLVPGFSATYAVWDQNVGALTAAGFRVLRYDHFGRGYSDRPDARYDPEFFDKQLLDLLDALKLNDKVDFAGESMGGAIAAAFVNRHPARAGKLIMIEPEYRTGYDVPARLRIPLAREYRMALIATHLPEQLHNDFVHPERATQYLDLYRDQMRYRGFRKALMNTMLNYWTQDSTAEYRQLGRTGRPVLLLWGVADPRSRIELGAKVREAIPQAEFHAIGDAGHFPAYEQPAIVNPLMVRFLRSTAR